MVDAAIAFAEQRYAGPVRDTSDGGCVEVEWLKRCLNLMEGESGLEILSRVARMTAVHTRV
ncbi:MAG: hypothetical protein HOQ33_13355 [Cupriavidus sp.]|nr:hypothetical protein [Cupriavidus sp.]